MDTVFRGIVRNYRERPLPSPDDTPHCPYQGDLHTLDDKPVTHLPSALRPAGPIPENHVVEIIVRVTDEDVLLGDDSWVLQRPHHYGPNGEVPDDQRDWKWPSSPDKTE